MRNPFLRLLVLMCALAITVGALTESSAAPATGAAECASAPRGREKCHAMQASPAEGRGTGSQGLREDRGASAANVDAPVEPVPAIRRFCASIVARGSPAEAKPAL